MSLPPYASVSLFVKVWLSANFRRALQDLWMKCMTEQLDPITIFQQQAPLVISGPLDGGQPQHAQAVGVSISCSGPLNLNY